MVSAGSLSNENSLTEITDLEPGDHLCCIYETEEEHRNVLTPFIKEGLEAREKVIYIVDANTAEEILNYLRDINYPPEPYLDSGQLVLLTQDQSYLKGGTFDPDAMIDLLEKETEKALDEGFDALRVTGEMTWALRGNPGTERLMEYENKLNRFFPSHKALGMCQYDKNQFGADVLLGVLRTHPIAVIGDETYENFHYIQPSKLLGDSPKEAEFRSWEDGLIKSKDKKLRLEHLNSLLRSIRDVNQLIVQEGDRDRLLKRACEILRETRGYDYAWIAMLDHSSGVESIAQSGLDEEIERLNKILNKDQLPDYLQEALDERGVKVAPDTEYYFANERLELSKDKSLMTCRVEAGGKVYGLLSISASNQTFYPQEERGLLAEVAGDIAFGLHDIEVKKREKQAQKNLERSERQFRRAVQFAPFPMMIHAEDGKVVAINDSWLDITGYKEEEISTISNWSKKAYGEERNNVRDHIKGLYELDRRIDEGEYEIRTKRGDTRIWDFSSAPIGRDEDGRRLVLSMADDVTDRKHMKQKVEKERNKARQYLDIAGSIIVLLDEERKIQEINRKGCQILGYDKEEIIGKDIYENFVPERAREDVIKDTRKPIMEGKTENASHYENPIVTKDGEERLIAWENEVVRENGQVVGTLSSGIDITERKKMEEELQQRSQELQSSFVQLAETTSRVLGVRDPYTQEHEQRVGELAREVGKRMGLEEDELLGLYL